jgi:hypothetical protein
MPKIFYKIINSLFILALFVGLIFYFEPDINSAVKNFKREFQPCNEPINYSLGTIDPKFNISQADFLNVIDLAAKIWQTPINKKLFGYAPEGGLKINLVYDSRQEATDKLKSLGINIHTDEASYEILKNKYAALEKVYNTKKTELENTIGYYEEQKANYEDEIKAANKRGGVNPAEFAIIEEERKALNSLGESIKEKQTALNQTVDDINAVAKVINRLISELNLKVTNYNTIGASSAGEFQEGQYVSDAQSERINIYQFDSRDSLVRVLAHELGHALGLDHLDNPEAIMYRLNESGNEKITADDLAALKAVCQIK